jgi:hypothetical protein
VGKRKKRAGENLGLAYGAMQALADQRDQDRGVLLLTVMADYGCSGLWKGRAGGPIAPEDLGLSPELCERVRQWSEAYQRELKGTDAGKWSRQGRRLAEAIQIELGPTAKVGYRPN